MTDIESKKQEKRRLEQEIEQYRRRITKGYNDYQRLQEALDTIEGQMHELDSRYYDYYGTFSQVNHDALWVGNVKTQWDESFPDIYIDSVYKLYLSMQEDCNMIVNRMQVTENDITDLEKEVKSKNKKIEKLKKQIKEG